MKTRQNLLALVLLCVGLFTVSIGCGDDDEGYDHDGGVPAERLNCEENWDADGGLSLNGRLTQRITITFRVLNEYDRLIPPNAIFSALTSVPDIPVTSIPVGVGQEEFDPELVIGETYTYTTEYHDRLLLSKEEEICGEYFYIMLTTYDNEGFPVPIQWTYISEDKYQVGGDENIVIEDVELVPGW